MVEFNIPGLGDIELDSPPGSAVEVAQPQARQPAESPPPIEPETTTLGEFKALAKGIPRGIASTAIGTAEGALELADIFARRALGTDVQTTTKNEWIESLRQARNHVERKGWFAPSKGYESSVGAQLGHGLGSLVAIAGSGGFAMAGLKGAGAIGKLLWGTRLGGVIGLGASEQADRVRRAELKGIGVSQGEKDLSLLFGGVVGITELAPIEKAFKSLRAITKAEKNFVYNALGTLRRAVVTGGAEGVQEATAGIMQEAIAKGIYDPKLNIFDSAWSEFKLGAGVGGIAQVALELATGRKLRSRLREAEREEVKELPGLRENSDIRARVNAIGTPLAPGSLVDPDLFNSPSEWAGAVIDTTAFDLPPGPYKALSVGSETFQIVGQGNQVIGGRLFKRNDAEEIVDTLNDRQEEIGTAREEAALNMRYRQQAMLSGQEPTDATLEATRQVHQAAGLFIADEVDGDTIRTVSKWRSKNNYDQATSLSLHDMVQAGVPKRKITQYLKGRLQSDAPTQLSKEKLVSEIGRLASKRKLFYENDPAFRRMLDVLVGENQLPKMNKTQLATVIDVLRRIPVQKFMTGLSIVTDPTYSQEEFEAAVSFYAGRKSKPKIDEIGGAIGSQDARKLQDIQNAIHRTGAVVKDMAANEYITVPPEERRPSFYANAENLADLKTEVAKSPGSRAPIHAPEATTPEEQNVWARVGKILEGRLADLGLKEYGVKPVDFIRRMGKIEGGDTSVSNEIVNAEGAALGKTIRIAMRMLDAESSSESDLAKAAAEVLDHEAIHAFRELDLITDEEFSTLVEYTKKTDRPGAVDAENNPISYLQWAFKTYGPKENQAGLTAEEIEEEAIAEAFRAWATVPKNVTGKPATIFSRIVKFISRLGNALAGNGFKTAEDVFDSLASGEIGSRSRGVVRALHTMSPERAIRYGFIKGSETGQILGDEPVAPVAEVETEERLDPDSEGDIEAEIPFEQFSRKDIPDVRKEMDEPQSVEVDGSLMESVTPIPDVPHIPVLDMSDFRGIRPEDSKVAGMIPGIYEVNQYITQAITDIYGDNAKTLDIVMGMESDTRNKKYDVVREILASKSMQIGQVRDLLNPDGIAIFQEKFIPGPGLSDTQFFENEELKADYQKRYFTEVNPDETILNLSEDAVAPGDFEAFLGNHFENVAQFWDSGNFKGYIASDSDLAFGDFLEALPSTTSEFSTVETPHVTKGDFDYQLPENEDLIWSERELFSQLPGDAFDIVPSPATGADNFGRMVYMGNANRRVVLFKGYHEEFDVDQYGSDYQGMGLRHIVKGHSEEIRGMGYRSVRRLADDFVDQMWTQRNDPNSEFSASEDSRSGNYDPMLVALWNHPQHGPIKMIMAPKIFRGQPILSIVTLYPVNKEAPDSLIASTSAIMPRISTQASPGAVEAVKKQNRPTLRLKPEAREQYSKRLVRGTPAEEAIYQRVGERDPKYTWGERFLEVVKNRPFVAWRQRWLNKYEMIGRVGLIAAKRRAEASGRPLNDYLMADVSAMASALLSDRATGVAAASFKEGVPVYQDGFVRVVTQNPVDGFESRGLVHIMKRVMEGGLDAQFALYARARRASGSLARRGIQTGEMDSEAIALGLLNGMENPWFEEVFNEYQRWNSALVKLMVDTGVIDEGAGREWMNAWDYIPFYRQLEYGENVGGPTIFNSLSNQKAPKKIKGGAPGTPFEPFIETITRNAMAAINASMKNLAGQRAVRDAVTVGVASRVPTDFKGGNAVTVRVKGRDQRYQIIDPLLFQAMTAVNSQELPLNPFLTFPARALRELVTKEPGFMAANLLRDTLSAWITSGRTDIPFAETAYGFGEALTGTGSAVPLRRAGVVGGFDFKGDITDAAKTFKGLHTRNPVIRLWRALDHITTASDSATRSAVYSDVLGQTGSQAQATLEALEVINFSRRGSSPVMRFLAGTVPFLNARIQGIDLLYRAGSGAGIGKGMGINRKVAMRNFYMRGLFLIGLGALYALQASDDEAWENANPETRDLNWLFPTGVGHIAYKLPIPFEVGILTKVIPERIMAYAMGKDTARDLEQSAWRNLISTLGINPMPQALKPLFEIWMNKSMYTQRQIEGLYLQNLPTELRFTAGTSEIAKWLGDTDLARGVISPAQIDHLFRGYTGTLGAYSIFALDEALRYSVTLPTGQRPHMKPEDWPFMKRFLTKEIQTGNLSLFYDFRQQARMAARGARELSKTGRTQAYGEIMDKLAKLYAAAGYTEELSRTLASLRNQRRMINDDSFLDGKTKRQMIDNIRRIELALTKVAKEERLRVFK